MATMQPPNSAVTSSLAGLVLMLTGCAYRFPAFVPPAHERIKHEPIKIVAAAPEPYSAPVDTGTVNRHDVHKMVRVKVGLTAHRPTRGVYLFNVAKVGGSDPLNNWSVSIPGSGKIIRKLSLRATQRLATDEAGYHVVTVAD